MAEVLITLGIIGVVAAFTLPSLINEYQKQVYVNSLKKFYSAFSQVLQNSKQKKGCASLECMGLGFSIDDNEWNDNLYNMVSSEMHIIKFIKQPKQKDRVRFYRLYKNNSLIDISSLTFAGNKDVVFTSKEGMKFEVVYGIEANISLVVDINGNKGPNKLGRDVFIFYIPSTDPEIYPIYGYRYSNFGKNQHIYWGKNSNFCNPESTSNYNGVGCAARIIESDWVMDY